MHERTRFVDPIAVEAKGLTRTGGKRLELMLENEHITEDVVVVIVLLMLKM